jgi:hypothetical protein
VIAYLVLILTFLFQPPVAGRAAQSQIPTAFTVLRASNPKVQWDAKTAVTADITCDGIADVIVVGYDDKSVWVALVPGMKDGTLAKPIVQQFPIDGGVQNGFCEKPVRIEVRPQDCEGQAGSLPGCKPTQGASEFGLYDDACDHFEFYWDSAMKQLRWSRN